MILFLLSATAQAPAVSKGIRTDMHKNLSGKNWQGKGFLHAPNLNSPCPFLGVVYPELQHLPHEPRFLFFCAMTLCGLAGHGGAPEKVEVVVGGDRSPEAVEDGRGALGSWSGQWRNLLPRERFVGENVTVFRNSLASCKVN